MHVINVVQKRTCNSVYHSNEKADGALLLDHSVLIGLIYLTMLKILHLIDIKQQTLKHWNHTKINHGLLTSR